MQTNNATNDPLTTSRTDEQPSVRWAMNATSFKQHAYRDGAPRSVCGYARRRGPAYLTPRGLVVCRLCCKVLRMPVPAPEIEPMVVEVVGGPCDGRRLTLAVVGEGPTYERLRVLEMTYKFRSGRDSAVAENLG